MAKSKWPQTKTLREYAEYLDQLGGETYWYRGSGTAGHPLLPSLFHGRKQDDVPELADVEKRLLTAFKHRSLPFLPDRPDGNWEWLFLMQHYRLPTRLLDWTENPLIALYFALTKGLHRKDGQGDFAAVWMLNPAKWNGWGLGESPVREEVLSTDDRAELRSYEP